MFATPLPSLRHRRHPESPLSRDIYPVLLTTRKPRKFAEIRDCLPPWLRQRVGRGTREFRLRSLLAALLLQALQDGRDCCPIRIGAATQRLIVGEQVEQAAVICHRSSGRGLRQQQVIRDRRAQDHRRRWRGGRAPSYEQHQAQADHSSQQSRHRCAPSCRGRPGWLGSLE